MHAYSFKQQDKCLRFFQDYSFLNQLEAALILRVYLQLDGF